MKPHTMTISETVRWSGIGRTKLYELIGNREIRAIKLGARTLVLTESVEQFLERLPALHST